MFNIPTWGWWAGGLAAVGLGGYALLNRSGTNAETAEDDGVTVAAPQPLFMASGGGGSSQAGASNVTDNLKEIWSPEKVPLSENPDVAIANINSAVQMAAINAAKELQLAGIQATAIEPVTPPVSSARTEIRKTTNIAEGAAFVQETYKKATGAAAEMAIYNAAKQAGYNKAEVAASLSAAGTRTSESDVDAWLKARGLSL